MKLEPSNSTFWNTLGVARYRAEEYDEAIEALTRSTELRDGGDAFDWLFLAMARWRLGQRDQARQWYAKAATSMERNAEDNAELRRFRIEAEKLMDGVPPCVSATGDKEDALPDMDHGVGRRS